MDIFETIPVLANTITTHRNRRAEHYWSSTYFRPLLWLKPQRPGWTIEDDYKAMPKKIEIRLVDIVIDLPGFRSKRYAVATTVVDTKHTLEVGLRASIAVKTVFDSFKLHSK